MPTTTYRAVFSDIDGTLLNSQHQITPKTVQAIQRIHRQGIPFILVSARPPLAMTPYTTQLQLQNALVCYSGALILDNDLNPLYSIAIEEKTLQRLFYRISFFFKSIFHFKYTNTIFITQIVHSLIIDDFTNLIKNIIHNPPNFHLST